MKPTLLSKSADNFYTRGIQARTELEKKVSDLLEAEITPPTLKNPTLQQIREEKKKVLETVEKILQETIPGEHYNLTQINNEVGRYIDRQIARQNSRKLSTMDPQLLQ
jgi:hypothetical protein